VTAATFSTGARPLGKSGLQVSAMAWGMWRFRGDDVRAAQMRVEAALDAGFTLLDTADVYGLDNAEPFGAAEALLGRVLAAAPALRDRFVLAGKAGIWPGIPYDSSEAYLTGAVEASLKRLNTERLDLFQIHRPDVLTHPAALARTLEALRAAGKIGEVGVSNFTAAQTAALAAHLPFPLAATQVEFSPLEIGPLTDGVLDQAMERDFGVLAWSPLGGGRLGDGVLATAQTAAVTTALDALAQQHGVPRSVIAYAWGLAHPARPIPIVGTQSPERIALAARALTIQLTRAEWYAVLTAARGAPLP
jgi:predicted oxidoreductase